MDIRKLQRVVVDALEDVKASDIKVYNSTGITQLFDRVIIASGTSNRQTRALAASVRDKVKAAGGDIVSVEGEDTGEWVLVDLGDAIVHVMQPAIRQYYNLEEIWGAKPVSLKSLDPTEAEMGRSGPSIGRSRHTADPARKAVARKSAARKTSGVDGQPVAPKRATRATSEAVVKPTGAKTAARKTAGRKTAAKTASRKPSSPRKTDAAA